MTEPATAFAGAVGPARALSLSSEPLLGLPLPELWFGLLFVLLGTFLFLDGFDFGAGAVFALRPDPEERETILAAVGPFWDGNEVWLVVFGGALFAAFPAAYAGLFGRHYLLMFAVLAALVLRGLAPELYEQRDDAAWRRWWGRSFVVGSVGAPLLLGAFVGNWVVGADGVGLAAPLVGLAVVALTVVSGAAFLRVKTRGALRGAAAGYGRRAVVAYLGLVVLALAAVAVSESAAASAVLEAPVLGLVALSVALGGGYVHALRRGRDHLALGLSAALTYGLVGVVALLLYPSIDPAAGLDVRAGIVSTLPLNLMSIGAALLLPLVAGYFVVLYTAFSGPVAPRESY